MRPRSPWGQHSLHFLAAPGLSACASGARGRRHGVLRTCPPSRGLRAGLRQTTQQEVAWVRSASQQVSRSAGQRQAREEQVAAGFAIWRRKDRGLAANSWFQEPTQPSMCTPAAPESQALAGPGGPWGILLFPGSPLLDLEHRPCELLSVAPSHYPPAPSQFFSDRSLH